MQMLDIIANTSTTYVGSAVEKRQGFAYRHHSPYANLLCDIALLACVHSMSFIDMYFICVIQPCNATTSSTFMICQTPSLAEYGGRLQYPITVEYGFIMDDVQQLRKLSTSAKPFTYIQDPIILPFEQTVVYKEGMKLTIQVSLAT
jgi:hypothetical protein